MRPFTSALIVVLTMAACNRDEPMANGKPLSHWKNEATKVSLFTFLNSDKDERRREAFRRLKEIGEPAVPALVDLFVTKRVPISGDAFNALANMGPRAAPAVPDMIEILKSDKPADLRRSAVWILGKIGPAAEPAVPHLTPLLQHPDPRMRQAAALALGQIGGAGHVALERAGVSSDARQREAAMGGLVVRQMAPDERRAALAKGSTDPSAEVRGKALELLIMVPYDEIEGLVEYLVKGLNDADAAVRRPAHRVFNGYLRNGRPSPTVLAAVLNGENVEARADAAWHLGIAKVPIAGRPSMNAAALDALTRALDDPEMKIRIYAGRALAQTEGATRARGLSALRRDVPNAHPILAVRGARVLWLAERDMATVRPVYERGLQDSDQWNRVETMSAIMDMGREAASFRPEFEKLRNDPSPEVRDRAAKALNWLDGSLGRQKMVEK